MKIGPTAVNSELPLPRTDSAELTIYSSLRNTSAQQVRGVLRATISRPGKPDIQVEQPVTLAAGENREITFDPARFGALAVADPDLWWPYTLGEPNLYDLQLEFRQFDRPTDTHHQRFGIRTVTEHRDQDNQFPELGTGGSFYLKVNGRDFLVRGAAYTPDLLFADDPARDAATMSYVKDLGLNMLRLEGKFPGERIVEMADEMGIPLMFGWMCCNQWEKWPQWDDEDNRVAQDSLRSQIQMLRPHASVFVWANGSDGCPPPEVLQCITGSCRICTGPTRSSTPCRRSTEVPTGSASGTASRWRARTVGDRRATGSADATALPAARPPSRATTKTSRRWRA